MFNKVVLVGNLTRDIELRYLPSGSAIGKTAIAVTRRFTGNTGEKKEEVCFIDIDFFGRLAEIANQYLNKGSKVLIEGRLKFDQWNDQNGQNRSKHSISVENMEMLGSNPNAGSFNNGANAGYATGGSFNNNAGNFGAVNGGNFTKSNQGYNGSTNAGQSFDPYANSAAKSPRNTPQQNVYAEEKLKEIDLDEDFETNDKNELPF